MSEGINDLGSERFGRFAFQKHLAQLIVADGNFEGLGVIVVEILDVQFRVKGREVGLRAIGRGDERFSLGHLDNHFLNDHSVSVNGILKESVGDGVRRFDRLNALIGKGFHRVIERVGVDGEGFRAIDRSFSHKFK